MHISISLAQAPYRYNGDSFSPDQLFAASEPGGWYDPSDITSMFQDTAATTPVTTFGQSVARINDKSGRGNHLTQSTAGSRPIYARRPVGGRRNLTQYTEEFANAYWAKGNATIATDTTTAPDGTLTADTLIENTETAQSVIIDAAAVFPAGTYTSSIYVKAKERSWVYLVGLSANTFSCYFDLNGAGAVGTATAGVTGVITSVGNGWFRVSVTKTFAAPTSFGGSAFGLALSDGVATYLGDGVSGMYMWGAQFEASAAPTAYQHVTSAYDVTEAGQGSLSALVFDGVDDFLATTSITPAIDKVQVFAGLRKLSDVASCVVVEHSASATSNAGTFTLFAPNGTNEYTFQSKGTAAVSVSADNAAYAAPVSNVLACIGDISGDSAVIHANGLQVTASAGDQGTGDFLAYPIYVGRRAGTSLPFSGEIYGIAVRFGENLSAGQIAQMEEWMNAKVVAY